MQAVPRGSRLIYNTGRALHKCISLFEEKRSVLPPPDYLITSVGTKVAVFQYSGCNNLHVLLHCAKYAPLSGRKEGVAAVTPAWFLSLCFSSTRILVLHRCTTVLTENGLWMPTMWPCWTTPGTLTLCAKQHTPLWRQSARTTCISGRQTSKTSTR